jgi:hypothetical protein
MSLALKILLAVLVVGVLVVGFSAPRLYLYRSPDAIESYLQERTPLGSSEADVAAYLESIGQSPKPAIKHPVAPASKYPL